MRLLIIFLIFSVNIIDAFADDPFHVRYTIEDGLPSNNIFKVVQDSHGFIWVATDKGVSRFDGERFENYSSKSGLDGEPIFYITVDENSKLWVATHKPALYIFENDSFVPYPFNDSLRKYTKTKRVISSLKIDRTGTVSIGIQYDGLIVFDSSGNRIKTDLHEGKVVQIESSELMTYSFLQNGKNLVSTPQITIVKESKVEKHFENLKFEKGAKGPNFYAALIGVDGLLVANYNYLYVFDGLSVHTKFYDFPIDCIYPLNTKEFFIGLLGGGILLYPNTAETAKSEKYFPNSSITDVTRDRNDAIWLGTRGQGLIYIPNFDIKWIGNIKSNVSDLKYKKERVYAGFDNGSVISFEHRKPGDFSVLVKPEFSKHDIPQFFIPLGEDSILIELLKPEIFSLKPRSVWNFPQELTNGQSRVFLRLDKQNLLIGTQSGLYSLKDPFGKKSLKKIVSKVFINDLYIDRFGEVWVASREGLLKIKDGLVDTSNIFIGDEIQKIRHILGSDTLIVLSKSQGIILFSERGRLRSNSLNSLTRVKDFILESKNSFLFLRDNQIYRAILRNGELKLKLIFTGSGFFQIERFAKIQDDFLFGTTSGLLLIHDSIIRKLNEYNPEIVILEYENTPNISVGQKIMLDVNRIDFNKNTQSSLFSIGSDTKYGLNRISSGKNILETKRFGLNNFVFKVVDLNTDDVVAIGSKSLASVSPIYRSADFQRFLIVSLAMIISFLVFVFWNYKKNASTREEGILYSELIEYKLAAQHARMNPHFIFNLINSVQSLIAHGHKRDSIFYLSKFSFLARKVLKNSKNEFIEITNEIEFLKEYLELENLRFNDKLFFKIDLIGEGDKEKIKIPGMILQPIIENSIKHGFDIETGYKFEINVSISLDNGIAQIIILDNGIGISNSKISTKPSGHTSYAQDIVRERLKVLSGTHQVPYNYTTQDIVFDGVVMGTKVELNMPYLNTDEKKRD